MGAMDPMDQHALKLNQCHYAKIILCQSLNQMRNQLNAESFQNALIYQVVSQEKPAIRELNHLLRKNQDKMKLVRETIKLKKIKPRLNQHSQLAMDPMDQHALKLSQCHYAKIILCQSLNQMRNQLNAEF